MNPHELKIMMENIRKSSKTIPPTIKKADTPSTPGLGITSDDGGILTVLDKQHFGRTFFVESDGIYTVKLGVFHDLKSGILEESALSFTLPIKAACERAITATFYIPEASARVMDAVILKSAQPFQITLVDGSPVLERYDNQWGMPLEYSCREAGNVMILERTGLRKNVPRQFKAYFDVLSIQIEVMFVI
ncbi:MAG: hypothetical protein HFI06_12700 [Eubacterium sp.]|jgi:hypothetical protein|nr:hypothetical protein [Eubacterium sp.]